MRRWPTRPSSGGQYRDDGIRASWVAPLDSLFVEVGAEALRGDAYPGGGNVGDFGAVQNLFAKVGGDIGQNSSWQLGRITNGCRCQKIARQAVMPTTTVVKARCSTATPT